MRIGARIAHLTVQLGQQFRCEKRVDIRTEFALDLRSVQCGNFQVIERAGVDALHGAVARVRSGDPRQQIWNLLSSADGHFHVGQWASGVGAWEVQYTEFELCHILAGVVRVSDAQGLGRLYRTGDTFVIPSGFRGTWEVIEPCRKLYAIYE